MAIRCAACHEPVHEQVVVCPHCGDKTGVPPDPQAGIEAVLATAELVAETPLPLSFGSSNPSYDPSGLDVSAGGAVAAGLAAVGAAASAAIDALVGSHDDEPVPRAVARERRRAPSEPSAPLTSTSDEDHAEAEDDAPRGAAPRYLK